VGAGPRLREWSEGEGLTRLPGAPLGLQRASRRQPRGLMVCRALGEVEALLSAVELLHPRLWASAYASDGCCDYGASVHSVVSVRKTSILGRSRPSVSSRSFSSS
jgi:hypothetical protein